MAWSAGRERDRAFWFLAVTVFVAMSALALDEAGTHLAAPFASHLPDLVFTLALAGIHGALALLIPRGSLPLVRALRHVFLFGVTTSLFVWDRTPENLVYIYGTGVLVIALAAVLVSARSVIAYTVLLSGLVLALTWPAGTGTLNFATLLVTGVGAIITAFIFEHAQNVAREASAVLEQRVAERTAQLARSNRTLREFTAAVSHDLRAPLSNIRAYAESELESGEALAPESRLSLEIILGEAGVLAEQVNNLLVAAQVDGDVLAPQTETLCVDELVADVVATVRSRFALAERRLEIAVPADLPAVAGDVRFCKMVLANLLDNAHKYSPAAQPIGVSAACAGDYVEISVRDHGRGIALEEQDLIFQRFQRGSAGGSGLGLGLWICRTLARAQRGEVTVRSTPGAGSSFVFRLPLAG